MSESITKDRLVSDIKDVIADAEVLVKETTNELSGRAKDARERLSKHLEKAKGQVQEWEHVVKDKAIEGAKETDRVIREHPYESLGVAFGVGLLIGILLNRK